MVDGVFVQCISLVHRSLSAFLLSVCVCMCGLCLQFACLQLCVVCS